MRGWTIGATIQALVVAIGCSGTPTQVERGPAPTDTIGVPLTDLGTRTYLGYTGGLYGDGANQPPADHVAEGLLRAAAIQPLDAAGRPDPAGKYVMLSIGMSNVSQEFCGVGGYTECESWTFMGRAASDPAVDRTRLVIVNGARGGRVAETWDSPSDPNYDRVRDEGLRPLGLSEDQVQIAWMKHANAQPSTSLPDEDADALALLESLGDIARAVKTRYPNLQQLFVSSRIYAGFATTPLNPEPYAYETGFAVKWLIDAQIEQMRTGAVDPRARDLDYDDVAPWLAWGPYLWAGDASSPRADGFFWVRSEFEADGTHPARTGEAKVAAELLAFFKTSPFTACWFLAGRSCG
ncbi:MAG: hypothetical protein ACRELD_00110 [Longimicrobiales bacterium]